MAVELTSVSIRHYYGNMDLESLNKCPACGRHLDEAKSRCPYCGKSLLRFGVIIWTFVGFIIFSIIAILLMGLSMWLHR